MIYTASYFDTIRHYGTLISISNSEPKGFVTHGKFVGLKPAWRYVQALKDGKITFTQFARLYRKKLDKFPWDMSDAAAVLEQFNSGEKHCTLLCWEKDPRDCHRYVLGHWLRKKGYTVVIH